MIKEARAAWVCGNLECGVVGDALGGKTDGVWVGFSISTLAPSASEASAENLESVSAQVADQGSYVLGACVNEGLGNSLIGDGFCGQAED